jgi:hypothetical protein
MASDGEDTTVCTLSTPQKQVHSSQEADDVDNAVATALPPVETACATDPVVAVLAGAGVGAAGLGEDGLGLAGRGFGDATETASAPAAVALVSFLGASRQAHMKGALQAHGMPSASYTDGGVPGGQVAAVCHVIGVRSPAVWPLVSEVLAGATCSALVVGAT